jgi:hypothetical protein
MSLKEFFWRLKLSRAFGLRGAFDRNFIGYYEED